MAMEKTFNAAQAEARIYEAWEQAGAFKAGANKSREESFTIMIPPPNVTGALHVGHAFNNTLQDILTRWHRMRGFGHAVAAPVRTTRASPRRCRSRKCWPPPGSLVAVNSAAKRFWTRVWEWKSEYGGTIIVQLKQAGLQLRLVAQCLHHGGRTARPTHGARKLCEFSRRCHQGLR